MKRPITDLIQVDPSLAIPIYKQIVQAICRNIENGVLARNDVLPSVNKIAKAFSLARGSVFTAYNDLRASGIIDSIPGKGYFVSGTETKQNKRIFLLFNTFSTDKERLYQTMLRSFPKTCTVHTYFHNHDIKTFETLIREQAGYYNIFIIMPEIHDRTLNVLSQLDLKRTFLLHTGYKEYKKEYPGVYQNFEKDLYSVLLSMQQPASKYKRLILVLPEGGQQKDMVAGLNKYSKKTGQTAVVKSSIDADAISKADAFIVVDDEHLVALVNLARANKWQLGKDIGVLSYNEIQLKSVVAGGISTISPDYEAMGNRIAEMAVAGKRDVVENPFLLIDRKSF